MLSAWHDLVRAIEEYRASFLELKILIEFVPQLVFTILPKIDTQLQFYALPLFFIL